MAQDNSNGYEAIAHLYVRDAGPQVGRDIVLQWSESLPEGADVLELGCGPGSRVSQPLRELGHPVLGIDASPAMVKTYRSRLPEAAVECADVLESEFFGRTFDAVVAWGLMFLLTEADQARLIVKVGKALRSGGRFLFTAPWQTGRWNDAMTGRESISLGRTEYLRLMQEAHCALEREATDEGENHYYFARKI